LPTATTHFGPGGRGVSALERLAHVLGDRAGDQQHVGMPRGGHDVDAEALEVVVRVRRGRQLVLACVARAGVDVPDGQRPGAVGTPQRGITAHPVELSQEHEHQRSTQA